MKVLVTGASGFVGGAVARHLVAGGHQVRALVRSESRLDALAGLPLEKVTGDVRDLDSLRRAVDGCEGVFHVAALYTFWAPDPSVIYDVNVMGTAHVLQAAREAQVRRVVYTSSTATIGLRKDRQPSDETAPLSPGDIHGHYKRSKVEAEQVALAAASDGQDVVVVNPSAPVGWGDVKPTPTGRLILDFLRRRMPAYLNTGLNLVDVDDVAAGHLLAYQRGRAGQRYILGHRNMTLREILETLAALTGRRAPALRLPYAVARAAATLDQLIEGRLLRREPAIPVEAVQTARKPMWFDASRAVRELGLPQTPVETALEKAVRWFREGDYLKGRTRR